MIEPLYPTSGRVGRQPIGVAKMLRMYCLQQWYGLADEALEDALYDSQALRDFVPERSRRASQENRPRSKRPNSVRMNAAPMRSLSRGGRSV